MVCARLIPLLDEKTWKVNVGASVSLAITGIFLLGVFCAPAIGGFVVVADMLKEYGICE